MGKYYFCQTMLPQQGAKNRTFNVGAPFRVRAGIVQTLVNVLTGTLEKLIALVTYATDKIYFFRKLNSIH